MERREFLKLTGTALASALISPQLCSYGKTRNKPNLIFILCDDLGYGDPSCYGGTKIDTPNIDALASDGMKFTQFYAGSPVCTPTRISCMTGHYPLLYNATTFWFSGPHRLPEGTVSLAHLLQSGGYATTHIGKWNLTGMQKEHIDARIAGKPTLPGPIEMGFDEYLTIIEGQGIHLQLDRQGYFQRKGAGYMYYNDKPFPPAQGWMDDVCVDEGLKMIEKYNKADRPFFMNVWYCAPHTPYEPAPEPHLSKYKARGATGNDLLYRSMVSNMDASIGTIVAKLKKLGIYENTFIFFTSDNGPTNVTGTSSGPLREGKATLYEGGIREPMIAVWPGHIPAGTETNTLGHTNDLLPTFCAAAGVNVPKKLEIDGLNLLPHMTKGKEVKDRGTVFWQLDRFRNTKDWPTEVARRGKWKLLACDNGRAVELYDIEKDPGETINLIDKKPEIAKQLTAELKAWLAKPRMCPRYDPYGKLLEEI
ncbi:sulfatase-like hydrolase/transferase [Planctomycetota bacterium]